MSSMYLLELVHISLITSSPIVCDQFWDEILFNKKNPVEKSLAF